MLATLTHNGLVFKTDFSKPIDVSLPIVEGVTSVRAWNAESVTIKPVVSGSFIGDINQGGSVNFRNISFNPHAHGTHTECVGHISKENYSINQTLKSFMFLSQVMSISPELITNDRVITRKQIASKLEKNIEALLIRTLPNKESKRQFDYSNANSSYLERDVMTLLKAKHINHLLIDTPSVDKEVDEGVLASHHSFWEYPENTNLVRTITELIFVPNTVKDGLYLLNLQIASFENDATPSKPVLYEITFDHNP